MTVAEQDDKFDLDFTAHFQTEKVQAEPLPPAPSPATAPAPSSAPASADKAAIDPEFRIGVSKLEANGFYVALARRAPPGSKLPKECKVYVVEDEPVTNAVLQKVLTVDGFKVRGAFDVEGFGKLLKNEGLPHLILLDIELPKGVSGLQILGRIRKHPKMQSIPVLIVTSLASIADVSRGMALGANGYLSKPATVESLRSVLRQILGALPEG